MFRTYGRRRKLTEAETQANAEERARRERLSMTCQCCGRRILANTGVIAHHGYERPGEGWQTASCMGARELPYEADRTVLGRLITILHTHVERLTKHLADVRHERCSISFEWTVNYSTRETKRVDVTVDTFDALYAEHQTPFRRSSIYRWDDLKVREIRSIEHRIGQIKDDAKRCQRRYDAWVLSHNFDEATGWTPCQQPTV